MSEIHVWFPSELLAVYQAASRKTPKFNRVVLLSYGDRLEAVATDLRMLAVAAHKSNFPKFSVNIPYDVAESCVKAARKSRKKHQWPRAELKIEGDRATLSPRMYHDPSFSFQLDDSPFVNYRGVIPEDLGNEPRPMVCSLIQIALCQRAMSIAGDVVESCLNEDRLPSLMVQLPEAEGKPFRFAGKSGITDVELTIVIMSMCR
jgi:hypothetical protein